MKALQHFKTITYHKWIEEGEKAISIPPRTIKIIAAKGSKSDFDESLSAF